MDLRVLALLAVAGCAAPAVNKDDLPTREDPADTTTSPTKKPAGSSIDETPVAGDPGQAPTVASATEARSYVFAHDDRALYRLAPASAGFTKVADFACLRTNEEVVDMAVSGAGAAYATTWATDSSYSRFLKFDPLTAACSEVAESTSRLYPNSLSFVPRGTVDAHADALVGYVNDSQGSVYVRIDLASGAMTDIGNLQVDLVSVRQQVSGDIVALEGGRAYVTVHGIDDASVDWLAEVNPSTGQLVRLVGATGFDELWGLAYWQGKAYGFSGKGEVVAIDLASGAGTSQTLGGLPSAFYGAAVSTVAPK